MSQSKRWAIRVATSALVASVLLITSPAMADVRLPHIIGSHMVLQQGKNLPVWGWGDPGEKVTVKLGDSEKSIATVDASGLSFAAIQGLYETLKDKDGKIREQEGKISALERRLARLEVLVARGLKAKAMRLSESER